MRTVTENRDPCGGKAVGPNFKLFVLRAQNELSVQISVVIQSGIKVLFFGVCCMLSVSFWSKTLIELLTRSTTVESDSLRDLSFLLLCALR